MLRILALGCLTWMSTLLYAPASAEAGPLLDWLRQRHRRHHCAQPAAVFPVAAAPAATCQTTCMQTCTRVVVNYVAETAYRATWEQVPVTTYRPHSTTDPCTGCTVTCMRPCTTYTWQMKQVPYTTYRPVYRTETYQVPVTTTTVAPAVMAPAACDTCPVPGAMMGAAAPAGTINTMGTFNTVPTTPFVQGAVPQTIAPQTYVAPNGFANQTMPGTIMSPGTPTPADVPPTLNPQTLQHPTYVDPNHFNSHQQTTPLHSSMGYVPQQAAPAQSVPAPAPQSWPSIGPATRPSAPTHGMIDPDPSSRIHSIQPPALLDDKSASSPAQQPWDYSPVRFANYQSVERSSGTTSSSTTAPIPVEVTGKVEKVSGQTPEQNSSAVQSTLRTAPTPAATPNQGWRSGRW